LRAYEGRLFIGNGDVERRGISNLGKVRQDLATRFRELKIRPEKEIAGWDQTTTGGKGGLIKAGRGFSKFGFKYGWRSLCQKGVRNPPTESLSGSGGKRGRRGPGDVSRAPPLWKDLVRHCS